MAVEIPVVVDIESGINDAAKRIPKAMETLQKQLSSHALNLHFKISDSDRGKLRDILNDTALEAKHLEKALEDVNAQINKKISGGAKFEGNKVSLNNQALLQARMALQTKYNLLIEQETREKQEQAQQTSANAKSLESESKELQKQTKLLPEITRMFGAYVSVRSVFRLVKQIRDVTGELEYQRVALGHLLNDIDFGNELFGRLVEAAKESPFRIKELVTYTKQLAAYRIESDKLFDTTMRLADISAGLGVSMDRLILAYGQVRAASVLRGQELRQFTEAGIPLVDELAKKFRELGREGTMTADVFKLISQRAVPFEMIRDIFEEMTNAGGQFYKMQEEQAKTLQGRWEKLKDAFDKALMGVGESGTFQGFNDAILKALNFVAKHLREIIRVLNAASMGWIAYKLTMNNTAKSIFTNIAAMIKQSGVQMTLRATTESLRASFERLKAAMSTNWIGLALTALATVITYLTTFNQKTKQATEELTDIEKAIEKMKTANEALQFNKSLISEYQELADKTARTSSENERLAAAMDELKKRFPEVADRIDKENLSLEEQVNLLNQAVDARHRLTVEEAKQQLDTQNQLIRDLKNQQAAARTRKESTALALREAEEWEKTKSRSYAAMVAYEKFAQEELKFQNLGVVTEKMREQMTISRAKAAKEASDNYEKISVSLSDAEKNAEKLSNLINPQSQTKDWQEWAKQIKIVQDRLYKAGDTKVFEDSDLQNFTSIYDLSKKLKKKIDDLTTSIKGMKTQFSAMSDKGSDAAKALSDEIARDEKTLQMAEAIRVSLGLIFGKQTKSDSRLSDLRNDISEVTNAYKKYVDLLKYMSKDDALKEFNVLFPQLKGWEPSLDSAIERIGNLLKSYKGPKDKVYKEMQRVVNTAISNLKFDNLKDQMEKELSRVAEEIKRSREVQDFYNSVLSATGDQDLATSLSVSVYGDIGEDLREKIQEQLMTAFVVDLDLLPKEKSLEDLQDAMEKLDWRRLASYLPYVKKAYKKAAEDIVTEAQKTSAEQIKTWVKELAKAKSYAQQRADIALKTQERIREIEASTLSNEEKESFKSDYLKKQAADTAKLEYEAFRDMPIYIQMFSDLETVSTGALKSMKEQMENLRSAWAQDLSPTELKELETRLQSINEVLAQRNPFGVLAKGFKDLVGAGFGKSAELDRAAAEAAAAQTQARQAQAAALEDYNKKVAAYNEAVAKHGATSAEAQRAQADMQIARTTLNLRNRALATADEAAEAAQKEQKSYAKILQSISNGLKGLRKWGDAINDATDGALKIMEAFSVAAEDIQMMQTMQGGLNSVIDGVANVGAGIAQMYTNPIGGVSSMISGIGSLVSGIGDLFSAGKVAKAEKEIKKQQKLIDDLQYSYDRLENQIDKAFGSDYIENYNKQVKNLEAQRAAYQAQARAEESKGKKKDKDKIKEYNEAARDAADKIADMRSQLSEFFTGTDVASAAKDFAEAWIEAYKEFGSTTNAMSEKFREMIEQMIQNSLAAKIMQSMLQPIFDSIDVMARDGALTASEIASISAQALEVIPQIDSAMTTLMNQLTAAGYNIRQTAGQFTGISRDIASASEESITGLAAGINTQNFYMSYMPVINENVAAIRAALTGEVQPSQSAPLIQSSNDLMMQYMSVLPSIDANVAELLAIARKVVQPRNTNASSHVIAVRM